MYRVVFLTGPTQKSSKYGTGPPQQEKMTKYTGSAQDLLTQKSSKYGTRNPKQTNCLLKTLLFSVSYVGPVYLVIFSCWGVPVPYLELFWVRRSWVGPVYLVIFSCWGRPLPYLELFWVGPVKKTTLYFLQYFSLLQDFDLLYSVLELYWAENFPAFQCLAQHLSPSLGCPTNTEPKQMGKWKRKKYFTFTF